MKNVILLTVDALRRDALGCYGNKNGLTPFVDSLQDKCIRFNKAQATGPYTQASFPGILTSSYYLDYGKLKGLAPERTLISEPLKEAGITTVAFHSNPYISGYFGWSRGWDVFYDSMEDEVDEKVPYVRSGVINSKIDRWLSSYAKDKPFFLWLHYMDIHEPYIPEKKYIDVVDSSLSLNEDEMYNLFKEVLLKRDVSDMEKVKLLKKLYDAHVREIDDHIKEFFGILQKHNLLQDIVIIITNDHGDEFGEHGGLSHDDKMYSELIDMLLLLYDPGRNKGEVCDTLVSNIDIPPTIIHLLGLDTIASFQGHSLLPLEDYPERGCFGEAIGQKSQKGGNIEKDVYFYRKQDLKIIYRANLDSWEMYDLKADPKELNNVVDKSPDAESLKQKLKPRVRRWM